VAVSLVWGGFLPVSQTTSTLVNCWMLERIRRDLQEIHRDLQEINERLERYEAMLLQSAMMQQQQIEMANNSDKHLKDEIEKRKKPTGG